MATEKVTLRVSKVKCSRCQKPKFVNPQALEKRLAKYGSIEEIEKNWVCRECINLEESGKEKELEGEKPVKEKKVKKAKAKAVEAEATTPAEEAKATIDAVAEPKYIDEDEGKYNSK